MIKSSPALKVRMRKMTMTMIVIIILIICNKDQFFKL